MRIRSNSCPEPLERQKVNFMDARKYIDNTKYDKKWWEEVIKQYFEIYEKYFNL